MRAGPRVAVPATLLVLLMVLSLPGALASTVHAPDVGVGHTWTYEWEVAESGEVVGSGTITVAAQAREPVRVGGVERDSIRLAYAPEGIADPTVRVEWRDPVTWALLQRERADGTRETANAPCVTIQFPLAYGNAAWTSDCAFDVAGVGEVPATWSGAVVGGERIATGAGTVDALTVDGYDPEYVYREWYSDAVCGLAKRFTQVNERVRTVTLASTTASCEGASDETGVEAESGDAGAPAGETTTPPSNGSTTLPRTAEEGRATYRYDCGGRVPQAECDTLDEDGDGHDTATESRIGSDPNDNDTDDDGVPDSHDRAMLDPESSTPGPAAALLVGTLAALAVALRRPR